MNANDVIVILTMQDKINVLQTLKRQENGQCVPYFRCYLVIINYYMP